MQAVGTEWMKLGSERERARLHAPLREDVLQTGDGFDGGANSFNAGVVGPRSQLLLQHRGLVLVVVTLVEELLILGTGNVGFDDPLLVGESVEEHHRVVVLLSAAVTTREGQTENAHLSYPLSASSIVISSFSCRTYSR